MALAKGAVAGTILVGHDGRRGLLHHLAVAPDHHPHGPGARLVAEALAGLRAAGIARRHLPALAGNAAGRAFWARIGAAHRRGIAPYTPAP